MTKSFTDRTTGAIRGHVRLEGQTLELQATEGLSKDTRVVHKFGHSDNIGTSYVPIANGEIYRTPQVSGATALRIKAGGDANDTAAGTGAREIMVEGLDAAGRLEVEAITTAGASASAATTKTFLRLKRAWVSASGTYASQSAGSHAGTIVIEDAAGTQDWASITSTAFTHAQTQIGVYTVPLGETAYVHSIEVQSESNKAVDVAMFKRGGILETSAPYTAMRLEREFIGIEGDSIVAFNYPLGPFPELTDVGFMAKVATGTASVSVDFTICLVKNLS
jgi:hypothetical protein